MPPISTSSAGYGGNLELAKKIHWRIRDASIAMIDFRGVITAIGVGLTYAFATIDGVTDSTRLVVVGSSVSLPEFRWLGTGAAHACALATSGSVYCWGSNWLGELGQGTTERYVLTVSPTAILPSMLFEQLAVGYYHNCALTSEGRVYCWGDNAYGQLGIATPSRSGTPVKLETNLRFVSLAAGAHTTCGVTSRRTVSCWGRGQRIDVEYAAQSDGGYVAVSVGSEHQCAITETGRTMCWGSNGYGELGNSSTTSATTPTPIVSVERFMSVTAGSNYTCAISIASQAFCWGHGFNGKLGSGSTNSSTTPVRVDGGLSFREIDAGADHSCATTIAGQAYCWGGDALEELGNGPNVPDQKEYLSPIPSLVQTTLRFEHVTASPDKFSCGVTFDHHAYCWGNNRNATLGVGSVTSNALTNSVKSSPTPLARSLHQ